MHIAVLADMIHATPPPRYGGTQRVVTALTEELVLRGHDVTLFATADSWTRGNLVVCASRALVLNDRDDYERSIMIQLGKLLKMIGSFDVVHSHVDYFAFPFAQVCRVPIVSTIHRSIDTPDMQEVYDQFYDVPLVAISHSQRRQYVKANWQAVIYNGLPIDHLQFTPIKETYLAFLGRICPEKGPLEAIEIARRTGIPLKMAARVDKGHREYYEQVVRKELDPGVVEFVGEIQDHEKSAFLGPAMALVFPIQWPEPFGLVLIEAMACGTPVVATSCGAVKEVVTDKVTGVLGQSIDDLVGRIDEVHLISPLTCRRHVENYFSIERMADQYEALFYQLSGECSPSVS